jgi:hypothetical protein
VKLKSQMQIRKRNSVTSKFPAEFKSDRSGVSGMPTDMGFVRSAMSFQNFQIVPLIAVKLVFINSGWDIILSTACVTMCMKDMQGC